MNVAVRIFVGVVTITALPGAVMAQVVSSDSCVPGQVATEGARGHCCWPGQHWSRHRRSCSGAPRCPTHFMRQNDGCVAEGPSPEMPPPVPSCGIGQTVSIDTAGHCCWPAQVWSNSRQVCIGVPQCPPGLSPQDDACVGAPSTPALTPTPSCPTGEVVSADTAGHCCWPAQVWSASRQACFGAPQCPAGSRVEGDACLPSSSVASAVPTPGTPAMEAPALTRHRFEGAAYLGIGSFTNTTSPFQDTSSSLTTSVVGPSVGLHLQAGYRVVPRVSLGTRFGYQAFSKGDSTRDLTISGLMFGAYARLYFSPNFAQGALEPWVGVGFDFVSSVSSTTTSSSGRSDTTSISTFGLPLSVGVDYNVGRNVSVGAIATLSVMIPREACAGNSCASSGLASNIYWFVGIGARYNLVL